MDTKRFLHVILLTLMPFSTALAQDKGSEAIKSESLTLKAQIVEFENLKAEIKAQEEKIDRLTQEVARLGELLKQKPASPVAKVEPTSTPAPAAVAANPSVATPTAGVDNPTPTPAEAANTKTHIVAKGETLTQISKQYGVSVEDIEHLNKIEDAKKLQAGQTIKIPASESPTPTP